MILMREKPQYAAAGSLLKAKRKAARVTQEELAAAADISAPYVAKLEGGRGRPEPEICVRLAGALGEAPDSILVAFGWAPVTRRPVPAHQQPSATGPLAGANLTADPPGRHDTAHRERVSTQAPLDLAGCDPYAGYLDPGGNPELDMPADYVFLAGQLHIMGFLLEPDDFRRIHVRDQAIILHGLRDLAIKVRGLQMHCIRAKELADEYRRQS